MKLSYPNIIYPDADLVNFYNTLWSLCKDEWFENTRVFDKYAILLHPEDTTINQFDTIMSTFFLVYGYPQTPRQLDFFYNRQEEDGAIRSDYNIDDGSRKKVYGNPHGIGPPLFSWAELNFYHRFDNKDRVRRVIKCLEKYWQWLEKMCLDKNGLYTLPIIATKMSNSPRENTKYPLDFNLQQAINANYMAQLGTIINDKDASFRYRKKYFSLRTHINNLMWDPEQKFYFDLDANEKRLPTKSIAAFWSLLAQLPNEEKLQGLINHLNNPNEFAQKNIFPTLSKDEARYNRIGDGYRGSVFPPYTYMIIKGLEKYNAFRSAKKYALQHIFAIIKTSKRCAEKEKEGMVEAYQAEKYACARWIGRKQFPRKRYVPYLGLAGIALVIENIIGINFSLPRKTVELTMTHLDAIGIENVALKKNLISIICDETRRGWEIHMAAEKLYYFTVHVLNDKKKTLPIPSGKCSLIMGKM